MSNTNKNINNVFNTLKQIELNSTGFQEVKKRKSISQRQLNIREKQKQRQNPVILRRNPYALLSENNELQEEQNINIPKKQMNSSSTLNISKKLNSINMSNLREETLLKISSIISNSIKNRPGQEFNSTLYEEARKKFIEFSNQIYLKAQKCIEEEENGLINLQNQVLDLYSEYFQNPQEIEDNLSKMNSFFIDRFLINIGKSKNSIVSEEISTNNLLKLEYLIKKFLMYFEEKKISDKKLIALINASHAELKFSLFNLSSKITEEAEKNKSLPHSKLLELIQIQQKLLSIYNSYFNTSVNDIKRKKIENNIIILENIYSRRFQKNPNLNLTKNSNSNLTKNSNSNIFSNKNEKEYLDKLSKIKDYDSFKKLELEVFELYKSHLEIAFSILKQLNLQSNNYNKLNKKFKNDMTLIFKSLEKIYRLYKKIFDFYLGQNFKKNEDLLLMLNRFKNHNSFNQLKKEILKS